MRLLGLIHWHVDRAKAETGILHIILALGFSQI